MTYKISMIASQKYPTTCSRQFMSSLSTTAPPISSAQEFDDKTAHIYRTNVSKWAKKIRNPNLLKEYTDRVEGKFPQGHLFDFLDEFNKFMLHLPKAEQLSKNRGRRILRMTKQTQQTEG
eukprot:GDKI01044688.1.p2 GENE.GDKI01044688.1~~GDKI01044688.1.p2  ORF type:complete len:120 (+),score=6.71 GDKI01044688.1:232-591(+)